MQSESQFDDLDSYNQEITSEEETWREKSRDI